MNTDLEMRVDFCRPQHVGPAQREAITRTMLETLLPGDGLGGLLASVDPAALDMHDLVSFMGACERQAAWVQATQLRAVRELAGRRLVPGPNGEAADTALPEGAVNEYAADEVAAVLAQSRFSGQKRVWLATALTRLPATEAAFASGVLNLSKTTAIAEGLAALDDQAAATAEARVLVRASKQTLGQLRASISRAVLAADPSTAKERAEKAKAERRVELTPRTDGMCEFWALLSAPDAMALYTAITALADQARAAEHAEANEIKKAHAAAASGCAPATGSDAAFAAYGFTPEGTPEFVFRTMGQLRADVLADMAYVTLERPDLPRNHRRRPHIQVTVAATTLLGLDELPGELAGFGPIPAHQARQVAADGTWRRLLTDPATGGLLDYGTTVYEPPKNLTDHVITRDQTCRGLGCRTRAERCDIDHTIRYPDGPTADHNLTCECRPCHIRKHKAGWQLRLLANGDVIWTSPTGHSYYDPVPPVLDGCIKPRAPSDEVPPF